MSRGGGGFYSGGILSVSRNSGFPLAPLVSRPAISPDLGRRLSAFSLHCRLTGFEVHFTGEIENLLAFFFSDRLFYYLR